MERTHKELTAELAKRVEQHTNEKRAIIDTLALLQRVDERRREHPGDIGRWNDRADRLEEFLLSCRGKMAGLEVAIRELRRELNVPENDPGSIGEAPPKRLTDPDTTMRPEALASAAKTILDKPIVLLDHVPLEQFAMARTFLSSSAANELPIRHREELRRRIGIYDRKKERERLQQSTHKTFDDRRQQIVLRKVIEKCMGGNYVELTLHEIDLLLNSYSMIVQQPDQLVERDRLLKIIDRVIDEICLRRNSLDDLKSALQTDS